MRTRDAIAERIIMLCRERGLALNALANISGLPPSTIYSILDGRSKNPGIVTIKMICDGLEITVREFFDSELFDEREQELI